MLLPIACTSSKSPEVSALRRAAVRFFAREILRFLSFSDLDMINRLGLLYVEDLKREKGNGRL